MCTRSELEIITTQLVKEYRSLYGTALKEVILYGSYARGDFDEESDIDIVAIVDQPRTELKKSYRKLGEVGSSFSLNYGLTISPSVIPFSDYTRYQNVLPYYRNISTEGILLMTTH